MAQLSDLKPSLSDLPIEQRWELHTAIRKSRFTPKAQPSKAAGKRKAERIDMRGRLDKMSPEEAKRLIALLKGE